MQPILQKQLGSRLAFRIQHRLRNVDKICVRSSFNFLLYEFVRLSNSPLQSDSSRTELDREEAERNTTEPSVHQVGHGLERFEYLRRTSPVAQIVVSRINHQRS